MTGNQNNVVISDATGRAYSLSPSNTGCLYANNLTTGALIYSSCGFSAGSCCTPDFLTLDGAGVLFFARGRAPAKLYAVNSANGATLWSLALGTVVNLYTAPVIGAGGMLYIGADDGTLFAVRPSASAAPARPGSRARTRTPSVQATPTRPHAWRARTARECDGNYVLLRRRI